MNTESIPLRDWLAQSATETDLADYIPQTTGDCADLFHRLGFGPKPGYQDSCRYLTRHNVTPKLRTWARYQYADAMLAARASNPT